MLRILSPRQLSTLLLEPTYELEKGWPYMFMKWEKNECFENLLAIRRNNTQIEKENADLVRRIRLAEDQCKNLAKHLRESDLQYGKDQVSYFNLLDKHNDLQKQMNNLRDERDDLQRQIDNFKKNQSNKQTTENTRETRLPPLERRLPPGVKAVSYRRGERRLPPGVNALTPRGKGVYPRW